MFDSNLEHAHNIVLKSMARHRQRLQRIHESDEELLSNRAQLTVSRLKILSEIVERFELLNKYQQRSEQYCHSAYAFPC